jgi:hypothetical protein
MAHATNIIKQFKSLMEAIKKHGISMDSFVKYLYGIFKYFEDILDNKIEVSSLIERVQSEISYKIEQFDKKMNAVLGKIIKLMKGLQKLIREREYIEMDYNIYKTQQVKFDKTKEMNYEESKIASEVFQKLQETTAKTIRFDSFLNNELPIFFQLTTKLAEDLSVIIYYHTYDIYECMYKHLLVAKEYVPQFNMDNIYFQNNSRQVIKMQKPICEQIEKLKLFDRLSNICNIYNFDTNPIVPSKNATITGKLGTALFSFSGETSQDLSFVKGDVVRVLEVDSSGWWKVILLRTGETGICPYNYFNFA